MAYSGSRKVILLTIGGGTILVAGVLLILLLMAFVISPSFDTEQSPVLGVVQLFFCSVLLALAGFALLVWAKRAEDTEFNARDEEFLKSVIEPSVLEELERRRRSS